MQLQVRHHTLEGTSTVKYDRTEPCSVRANPHDRSITVVPKTLKIRTSLRPTFFVCHQIPPILQSTLHRKWILRSGTESTKRDLQGDLIDLPVTISARGRLQGQQLRQTSRSLARRNAGHPYELKRKQSNQKAFTDKVWLNKPCPEIEAHEKNLNYVMFRAISLPFGTHQRAGAYNYPTQK